MIIYVYIYTNLYYYIIPCIWHKALYLLCIYKYYTLHIIIKNHLKYQNIHDIWGCVSFSKFYLIVNEAWLILDSLFNVSS
jgi:hypothetical protein